MIITWACLKSPAFLPKTSALQSQPGSRDRLQQNRVWPDISHWCSVGYRISRLCARPDTGPRQSSDVIFSFSFSLYYMLSLAPLCFIFSPVATIFFYPPSPHQHNTLHILYIPSESGRIRSE